MESKIPIFDWHFPQDLREQFHQGVEKIFDQAYLSNHHFTQQFEENFARFQHLPVSLACNNGTGALELMLLATVKPGDEVIIPANTFIATWAAVKRAQGVPVLCDVEEQFFSLDPQEVEKKISKKTKAILTVHLAGIIAPCILRLKELAETHGLILLEDAAHAHGAHYQGQRAGHFGVAAGFSHFLTKVMTTGEGGSVVTHDLELDKKMRNLRQFGREEERPLCHQDLSSNYKISEFQSLLGILELSRLPERLQKRRELALRYQENLKGSHWHALGDPLGGESSYYKQVLLSSFERPKLREYLSQKGIALTGGVYDFPLSEQPVVMKEQRASPADFPVTRVFSAQHFCPPCYPELEKEQIDFICQTLLDFSA